MSSLNAVADSLIATSLAQTFGVELPKPEPTPMQIALKMIQQKRLDDDLTEKREGFFDLHIKDCVGDCAKATDEKKLCFRGRRAIRRDDCREAL